MQELEKLIRQLHFELDATIKDTDPQAEHLELLYFIRGRLLNMIVLLNEYDVKRKENAKLHEERNQLKGSA